MKPILDLCCGGGGATRGIMDLGYPVQGIDIKPQSEYPTDFIQEDLLNLTPEYIREKFSAAWASPPCQMFVWGTRKDREEKFVNLIPQTRELLEKAEIPFVIENVTAAPLRRDLLLCGEMFRLRVLRHRIFEIHGFKVPQPRHRKHKRAYDIPIEIMQNPPEGLITEPIPITKERRSFYDQVAGHGGDGYSFKIKDWQKAMEIDWIQNRETLVEAIPPAYSSYIFSYFKLND